MARYLQQHYVGKYRVIAEYNKATNDYPRITQGNDIGMLDPSFDDLYIPIKGNGKIMHVGGNVLQAYIPSLGRGHNILKAIYDDMVGDVTLLGRDFETINKQLTKHGLIFDIEETDTEILFKFKADTIEIIAQYLHPKTNGAKNSPFSTKNLPHTKYDMPDEDLTVYKQITSCIPKENIRVYNDINNGFMATLVNKKLKYTLDDIKADMKLKGLKGKEYFHSIGKWNLYVEYITLTLVQLGLKL
jgi:hypothetical protein